MRYTWGLPALALFGFGFGNLFAAMVAIPLHIWYGQPLCTGSSSEQGNNIVFQIVSKTRFVICKGLVGHAFGVSPSNLIDLQQIICLCQVGKEGGRYYIVTKLQFFQISAYKRTFGQEAMDSCAYTMAVYQWLYHVCII